MELELLTSNDADNSPAGLGRKEPLGLPEPKYFYNYILIGCVRFLTLFILKEN